MARELNKRPRRTPLTSEEVAHIIAYKKKRELVKLHKLKKSREFKVMNIFNLFCVFVYLEVIFCYMGPCHYEEHYAINTVMHYGTGLNGKLVVSDVDIYTAADKMHKVVIEEDIASPGKDFHFIIGKDFLLQKELKAVLEHSSRDYRLFAASPVLFLCIFVLFVSCFAYIMNMNENTYGLTGLTTLNVLSIFAISML